VPWIVTIVLALVSFWIAKRNAPELVETWHRANTIDGDAA
jgi:hypothetical protein